MEDRRLLAVAAVNLLSNQYSVGENETYAYIDVVLNPAPTAQVTVYWTTAAGGTATANADHQSQSSTLTFNPGESRKSFPVRIYEDPWIEGPETVRLSLTAASPASAGVLGSYVNADLTIIDNDSYAVTAAFDTAQTDYPVGEADGSVSLGVRLSGTSSSEIRVTYTTAQWSALPGYDYLQTSGTLVFPPNTTYQVIPVQIVNDLFWEPTESLGVLLTGAVGAAVTEPHLASITINDDDQPPQVYFDQQFFRTDESPHSAILPVFLTRPYAFTVTVPYQSYDGTATAGSDYTQTSGTLTFAPGTTERDIFVPILYNSAQEGAETFTVNLGPPTNAFLGSPATASVTIVDAVLPTTAQFSATSYVVDETAGFATITVTLTQAVSSPLVVDYSTVPVTATANADYTAVSGQLTFNPGDPLSKTFTVPILDDTQPEGDETLLLSLSVNAPYLGYPSRAILTIRDNETAAPKAKVENTAVPEGVGTANLRVTLSTPYAQQVTVTYQTADGTATVASGDYTPAPPGAALTFTPPQTELFIPVSVTDDTLSEPSETVNLTLNGQNNNNFLYQAYSDLYRRAIDSTGLSWWLQQLGGSTTRMQAARSLLGIGDNEQAVVLEAYQRYLFRGADPSGRDFWTAILVTPTLRQEDFQANLLGSDEYFLARTDATNAGFLNVLYLDVLARPIDASGLSFWLQQMAGGMSRTTVASWIVTSTDSYNLLINRQYQRFLQHDADTNGLNYWRGELQARHVRVEALQSALVGSAEYSGHPLGAPAVGVLTIHDGPRPSVTIEATDVVASESNPSDTGLFTLRRTGSTAEDLTVFYDMGGTAWNEHDYSLLSGVVTIPAGSAATTLTVNALNDGLLEGDETVLLTLAVESTYDIGAANSATVTIPADASDTGPQVTVAATDPQAAEDSLDPATFTIFRTGSQAPPLTVSYSLGGTALMGQDYSTLSGSVTIPAGSSSAAIRIDPINDILAEGDETITLTLIPTDTYQVGSQDTDTATLSDGPTDTKPSIMILDKDKKNSLNLLYVAKWTGVNTSVPPPANVDVFSKDADRFHIRVKDPSKAGQAKITVKVSTIRVLPLLVLTIDGATDIELTRVADKQDEFETPTDKSLILVSNKADNAYPVDGIANNAPGDRSHLVALDDYVQVEYTGADTLAVQVRVVHRANANVTVLSSSVEDPWIGEPFVDKATWDGTTFKNNGRYDAEANEAWRDIDGDGKYTPRLSQANATKRVQQDVRFTNEVYAQVGVLIIVSNIQFKEAPDPVATGEITVSGLVNVVNGLNAATAGERALLGAGFSSQDDKDLEVYYVVRINGGTSYIAGASFPVSKYRNVNTTDSTRDFNDSFLIPNATTNYAFGHEAYHIFSQDGGHPYGAPNLVVIKPTLVVREEDMRVGDTKRLTDAQGKKIYGSEYKR